MKFSGEGENMRAPHWRDFQLKRENNYDQILFGCDLHSLVQEAHNNGQRDSAVGIEYAIREHRVDLLLQQLLKFAEASQDPDVMGEAKELAQELAKFSPVVWGTIAHHFKNGWPIEVETDDTELT